MLFIMQATQILLCYNYHMITACAMVILCMNPLIENMVVPWRHPADTEPPALVTSTPPPKLCCQRTNEPIWLLVRQKGQFGGLRGLDESLQLRRLLCLLVSPVEPEVHTGMVWWRRVSCGGLGASAGGVPQEFPVSCPWRSCWRWSGTAPSALLCLLWFVFPPLPPPLYPSFWHLTISQFAQRLCQTSGGEKSAEENGDGVVKHEKGNKAEEHKMECVQQKEGGWAGCWL